MAHSPGFQRLRRLFAIASWARRNDIPAHEAEAAFERCVLDRRSALQGMAAAATAAFVPTMLPGCRDDEEPTDSGGRVAVVGAGVAGLHCAHRLRQADVEVTVYEAQNRVGGRMFTDRETFPGGMIFELGGELIDSNHETLLALADEFELELDDRWSFEPPGMIRETWYFAGARVTNETLLAQTMAIAATMATQLEAAETDDAAFEELDNTSLQAWLDQYLPLDQYPELHEALRVSYVGEYGLEADEQSVLNLHYLFGFDAEDEFLVFGDSDERWHTHGGNDLFTTALADAVGADNIRLESKLIRASGPASGPFTLTFESMADGTSFEVEADHVVLALPFTLLRKVDLSDLELTDLKREIIAELGYGTNAKVMGHFNERPWWDMHDESGLLTTDLGVQQGWDTTIGQTEVSGGVWTNFLGGEQGTASGAGTAEDWFAGVLGDLETIWPGSEAAYAGLAARMHWPSFPYSLGSYTCYRPGQWAYWSQEGVREGNVHFCGEHCSLDFQGWMEGAAETGGLVAAEILDDLAMAPDALHLRAIGPKLAIEQACYHGDQHGRIRWTRRARRGSHASTLTARGRSTTAK